jgi:flagella basal body P-ring formation protein FlgA
MAEVVVIMRREAQSSGRYVRVCDIARVDGPKEQAREVAETVLGPAPATGEVREITRWDIESRLFEMGVAARVAFSGNDMVMVRGQGASAGARQGGGSFRQLEPLPGQAQVDGRRGFGGEFMDMDAGHPLRPATKPAPRVFERDTPERPQDLKELLSADAQKRVGLEVANYFAERYKSAKSNRSDIEVEAKILSATGQIPYSAYEVKVEDAEGRIPGKASLRLRVKDTDESPARVVTVLADTDVFAKALVAVRNIARQESLVKNDVAVARVRMESGKSYLPPNPQVVVGRESKRAFKPGEILLAEDAPMGEAVKRGKIIVVQTEGKGWDVKSKGKALEAGAVGDIITVEDLNNKNKFLARVTGPSTASALVKYDPHGIVEKK